MAWKEQVLPEIRACVVERIVDEFRKIEAFPVATLHRTAVVLEKTMFQWACSFEDYIEQIRASVEAIQLDSLDLYEPEESETLWSDFRAMVQIQLK
ncbi:hypothetical protein FVE85_0667 [Porphyridium purpureum]|uniref:Mediator complex subunit 15 KIX domain-containing protein n=1 Tax=Porphyridium purpureum TaxID=35688 RepID=A0A5J4Z0T4_PORPP|nr:hypothetical protein FVE85_0667 [Porphyridium purpureum]|eukprot:POR3192..scf208_2